MADDGAFLQSLLDDPRDDNLRLIYADWLDEQGDAASSAKAEFLRLTVVLASNQERKGKRKTYRKRLQKLATDLDNNWLAVVSRLPVENCLRRRKGEDRRRFGLMFNFLCDRRWEDLRPTDARNVRSCETCQKNVHYCDTITDARKHAEAGHCVAVNLGVPRHDGDLVPMQRMGMVTVGLLETEREPTRPAPVSPERERRKKRKRDQKRSDLDRDSSLDENE